MENPKEFQTPNKGVFLKAPPMRREESWHSFEQIEPVPDELIPKERLPTLDPNSAASREAPQVITLNIPIITTNRNKQ